ncbi:hypothetical protein ACJ41O_006731 [Fusarium nematophilum]
MTQSTAAPPDASAARDGPPTDVPIPRRADGYGSFPPDDNGHTPKPTKQTRALAPDLLRGFLMLAMALDHTALSLNTWEHGTGRETEADGTVISSWNRPAAYVVRTLTHLCASGFTMLLGVGVVYLGRSRSRLGWSPLRIARYFAVRTLVLTLIGVVLGLLVSGGQVWFMNFVLFALAVDYLIAGLLWLLMDWTEPLLAGWVSRVVKREEAEEEAEEEALLSGDGDEVESSEFGRTVSWHVHNAVLAVLGLVTIWWNIWLSPTHGHCEVKDHTSDMPFQPLSVSASENPDGPAVSHNALLGIWFWTTITDRVVSAFPPLAWLSFAILGLLYARVDIARTWTPRVAALCNTAAALFFLILFVLTRVLRFGNLSEDCLQTPEHDPSSDRNPYLASPQSFFYIIKYPPDVAFWAFTLAGNFLLLAFFGGIPPAVAGRFTMLLDFGRAALFFYIAHLLLVFMLGPLMVKLFGHDTGSPEQMDPHSTRGIDNVFAYFGIWAFAMLLLWPLTRWYGRFKSSKPADSIWRFF